MNEASLFPNHAASNWVLVAHTHTHSHTHTLCQDGVLCMRQEAASMTRACSRRTGEGKKCVGKKCEGKKCEGKQSEG